MSWTENKQPLSTGNRSGVQRGDSREPQERSWGPSPAPSDAVCGAEPPIERADRLWVQSRSLPPGNSPSPPSYPAQHPGGPFADTAPRPHFLGLPACQEQREERDDRTAMPLPSGFGTSQRSCFIQKGEDLQMDCSSSADALRPLVPVDAQRCAAGAGRPRRPAGREARQE